MNQIYLFGHKKPDTDSIASVIGYAEFKNRSEPGKYVPARCGDLNPETRYMLERFWLESPAFIPTVEPRLDAFGVGRMINLSLPAREVMEKSVPVLALTDTLAYARQVVSGSKFRAACVVTPEGKLAGVLTRTTLLDDVRRSVILLDHNEASQAVDGIEEAEIVEIIDHHRLGPITTLKPIRFLNDPVGATSTIIAMKFLESGLVPSRAVAGALLAGILSDTLALRMSTTTHRDKKAVEFLAPLAGADADELGKALLERGMDLSGVSLATILSRETKEFELSKKQVIISQVMVPSFGWNRERSDAIRAELAGMRAGSRADLVLVLFTSVMENASEVYGDAEPDRIVSIFGRELPVKLEGVMSRKKDFLPWLGGRLRDQSTK